MQKENCYKVSVIIPVYKVEEYLDECVKSILNQTYKNLEIILIDDGSPDNCPKMCDEYAKIDNRVKVIHKENGGQSSARNIGIDVATGDYLFFVDSDDYVSKDIIEVLINKSIERNSKIVACGYVSDPLNLDDSKEFKIKEFSPFKVIKSMLKEKVITTSPWAKIFKKELFEGIRFQEGKIYEDLGTIYKVFDKTDKVVYVDTRKYFYRYNPTSTTKSQFTKKQMDYFYIIDEMRAFFKEKYPRLLRLLLNHETRNAIAFMRRISIAGFSDEETIDFLVKKIRKGYFRYLFSSFSFLSKAYGLIICMAPKSAIKLFKK